MRLRNTIEYLSIWEQLNNSAFNPIEFDRFYMRQALTFPHPDEWRKANPRKDSNMRDYATIGKPLIQTE
jgi:hypothetical protein